MEVVDYLSAHAKDSTFLQNIPRPLQGLHWNMTVFLNRFYKDTEGQVLYKDGHKNFPRPWDTNSNTISLHSLKGHVIAELPLIYQSIKWQSLWYYSCCLPLNYSGKQDILKE